MSLARALLVAATLTPAGLSPAFAADGLKDQWQLFRTAFPMHIQTIAASGPDRTGALIVIIAEPPPDTLPKATYPTVLKGIFGAHLAQSALERTEIGLHGWVDDVVLALVGYNSESGSAALRDDLALLATKLWGTSYKSAPLALPVTPPSLTASGPPNIAIRQSELRDWLLGGGVSLSRDGLPSHPPQTLSQILSEHRDGAFLSAPQRGLAILVLNRKFPVEHYRAEFRKFALDSDLVLGAVEWGSDYLVFVGRERDTPVTIMQPLRFETARLLVTSNASALSQSYERTDLFAGRLEQGIFAGWDWAPIYLSPVLVDTELGSVLNITDQMLKSWSMGGQVKYRNFAWPTPTTLPFNGKPIMSLVAAQEPRIQETLFNWNTTGAFSRVEYGTDAGRPEADITAILYSGSLPMIYEDETQPEFNALFTPFEVNGYAYYRSLRNPLLTRVTSYQVLFQATRDHPLRTESPVPETVVSPPSQLGALAKDAYEKLQEGAAKLDAERIAGLCFDPSEDNGFDKRCVEAALRLRISTAIWSAGSQRLRARITEDVLAPREVEEIEGGQSDRLSALIKAIQAGRPVQVPADLEPALAAVASRFFLDATRLFGLVEGDDKLKAFQEYTSDKSENPNSYITTPRVVVSSAGSEQVGGHDLSGVTPIIVPDVAVPPGIAQVVKDASGANAIHLNPGDIDKAGPVARQFAKRSASGTDEATLHRELRAALARNEPSRSMGAALFIERPNDPVRGYAVAEQPAAVERISGGWQPEGTDSERLHSVLAIASQLDLSVVVNKVGDRFVIVCVYCASGQEVTALSHVAMRESVVDAIAHAPKGTESRIYFEGFTPDEVSAFKESLAFDGGGMEPPIGPPDGGVAEPDDWPRWWNRGGKGSGGDSGGGRGAGGSGGRPHTSLLVLTARETRSSAHEMEIETADGSRPASIAEWVAVRREMNRSVDWSAATVGPVIGAGPASQGQPLSLRLVIPSKNAAAGLQGRVDVDVVASAAGPEAKSRIVSAAEGAIMTARSEKAPFLAGVTRLIDRIKALPYVADVRFFFSVGRYDAILSQLERSSVPSMG